MFSFIRIFAVKVLETGQRPSNDRRVGTNLITMFEGGNNKIAATTVV